MKITILGGGLAGLSIAYFLQCHQEIHELNIIEKEEEVGGLCRSFSYDGRRVDIGPHIFFSKNKETLQFMVELLEDNHQTLRRSNRILYQGRFVQYPFENDLSKLPKEDCQRCLNTFLHNPYREYESTNMLQFFLKTFGEGITNLYLRPYNEKIWKFSPAFMDTQMVERIPRPPEEHILRSAAGECIDGYTHQLYFSYPVSGGTGAFIKGLLGKLQEKVKIYTGNSVLRVSKKDKGWCVETNHSIFECDLLISCIPVDQLTAKYAGADSEIIRRGSQLRFNHIMIALATVCQDQAGDNFAFMVPDQDVLFHRLSKIDFLGENYHRSGTATYMMEYTYRDNDFWTSQTDAVLKEKFLEGLLKIHFIDSKDEVQEFMVRRFPYAYVIYDMDHHKNMEEIRRYFQREGLVLNGRFGNFEYWNMDQVIEKSKETAENIVKRLL